MGRNLIALLQADGRAAIDGASFHNVSETESGIKMSDYNIDPNGVVRHVSWDALASGSAAVQPFRLNFIRQTKAHLIQNNSTAAYSYSITSGNTGGASATLNSVTAGGSPAGAYHETYWTFLGCTQGSSVGIVGSGDLSPAYGQIGDQWPVRWSAVANPGSASGATTMNLSVQYTPDLPQYNPLQVHNVSITVDNRSVGVDVGEYEIEWFRTSAYSGTAPYTGAYVDVTYDPVVYPQAPYDGLAEGFSATLYLRYRIIGSPTWTGTSAAPIAVQYSRPFA